MGEALVARRSGGGEEGIVPSEGFYTPSCDPNNSDIRLYTDDTSYTSFASRNAFVATQDRVAMISTSYYLSLPGSNVPSGKRMTTSVKFAGFSKVMVIFNAYGTTFMTEEGYATTGNTVICLQLGKPLILKHQISGVWHEITMELYIDSSGYLCIKTSDTAGVSYSINSNTSSPVTVIAER